MTWLDHTVGGAPEALRRIEQDFQALVERAPDIISRFDRGRRWLYVNPAIERATGIAPAAFIGKTGRELGLPAASCALWERMLDEAFETAREVRFDFVSPTASGCPGHYQARLVPELSLDGAAASVVAIVHDVSELKQAEEALRFQKSLLEAQGEASIEGTLVISPEGRILSYNRRFAEMWGIPEDILRTRSDAAALSRVQDQLADPVEFLERIAYLYRHPTELSHDELRLRDGRTIDRYSAPVRDGAGNNYGRVWFFRDVTDRKAMEGALRASEQTHREAAEFNRRLVLEVDHRVKNNLASLLGLISLVKQNASSVEEFADAVEGRIRAMVHTHQLLADSEWRELDMREIVESTLRSAGAAAGHAIVEVSGPPVAIRPSSVAPLTMILVEWLTNSSKYGAHRAPGGRVRIAWEVHGPNLRLSWTESGGPSVVPPRSTSLGTELVHSFAAMELRGRCSLTYPSTGVEHELEFPL